MLSKPSKTCFCTAVTSSHLAYACVLANDLRALHPDCSIALLLIDNEIFLPHIDGVDILLRLHSLGLPEETVTHISFAYSPFELSCALRGSLFRVLLEDYCFQKVIFLDSDISVYGSLSPVIDTLDTCSFVLTPHISTLYPAYIDSSKEVRNLLTCGLYNAGFLALSRDDESRKWVRFHEEFLLSSCFNDHDTDFSLRSSSLGRPLGWPASSFMFTDQLPLNLLPLFSRSVSIVTDLAYNLGHWNLWQADSLMVDAVPLINGLPIVFAHFSGCSLDSSGIVKMKWAADLYSSHKKEADLLASFSELARIYLARVADARLDFPDFRYGFEEFSNGELITSFDRRIYASLKANDEWAFGSPFTVYETFFAHQLYRVRVGHAVTSFDFKSVLKLLARRLIRLFS